MQGNKSPLSKSISPGQWDLCGSIYVGIICRHQDSDMLISIRCGEELAYNAKEKTRSVTGWQNLLGNK